MFFKRYVWNFAVMYRSGSSMRTRWPFRAALGFVVGYQIVGPLLAGEQLIVRWWT